MWKEKIKHGKEKKKRKKENVHRRGEKKNGHLIFLLSVRNKWETFYIQYNKLFDET